MGIIIKRNKEKKYQLISSINDKRLHKPMWVSERAAKKILIERAFWRFFEELLEINVDFPLGYHVNGKRIIGEPKIHQEKQKIREMTNEELEAKWNMLKSKYKLDI